LLNKLFCDDTHTHTKVIKVNGYVRLTVNGERCIWPAKCCIAHQLAKMQKLTSQSTGFTHGLYEWCRQTPPSLRKCDTAESSMLPNNWDTLETVTD